jgi:SAM-dependent methyltransferase
MATLVKTLMIEPSLKGLDPDAWQTTTRHLSLIQQKPILKAIYGRFYQTYQAVWQRSTPGGLLVEIGAGGGFAKTVLPHLLTTDILALPNVDEQVDAHQLPWADGSVSTIVMQNVLHHIRDPKRFFTEAQRVLKPGGKVLMIEPYHSPVAAWLRKTFHHEPYDETARDWSLPLGGPLSTSNLAMPWTIFVRDAAQFHHEFPGFAVRLKPHTLLSYFLSGGITYRSLLPGPLGAWLVTLENYLPWLYPWAAYYFDIELTKKA